MERASEREVGVWRMRRWNVRIARRKRVDRRPKRKKGRRIFLRLRPDACRAMSSPWAFIVRRTFSVAISRARGTKRSARLIN